MYVLHVLYMYCLSVCIKRQLNHLVSCILTTSYINICMCVLHFCVTFCLICMHQIMYEYVCVYVRIVLNVCNCTHERTNKISCILYLVS